MLWIVFALLAPVFWVFSNFVDKYTLERYTKGIFDFLFFSTLTSWLFVIALVTLFGFPVFIPHSIIPVLLGMALIYSYGFYGKSLEQGETSRLIILFQLVPVLTLVLAFLFLGQVISLKELLAFLLVLIGATAISLDKTETGVAFTKGVKWMLISIAMWVVILLFADYALTKMPFDDFFILDTFGTALASIPLLLIPFTRRQIIVGIKTAVPKKYGWFVLTNSLDLFGQMSVNKSLALAPSAGLVTVAIQVQSFYGIVLGFLLTMLLPHVFKEDVSIKSLGKKIVGAFVMFGGIALLFF